MNELDKYKHLVDRFAARFSDLEYFGFRENENIDNQELIRLLKELGYYESDICGKFYYGYKKD